MLISQELKRALYSINDSKITQFTYAGSVFTLKISEKNNSLQISAPVYWGGNYIPHSVRDCLVKRAPFDEGIIRTSLKIDEDNFSVELHFEGDTKKKPEIQLEEVFDEFSFLVNEWKEWLDQHDKNDLVHIYNKR